MSNNYSIDIMPNSDKKIHFIDGSGFIFRAYHALPSLTRNDGTPVGALLGFCNILIKLLDDLEVHKLVVVFDSKRKNYRHDIYPEYKSNRLATPEDLIPQFELIREACHVFKIPQVSLEGYEADDIIATYAKHAKDMDYSVVIVSSDKDMMQLINEKVKMFDPIKNNIIDYPEVAKKFFATPDKVIDIQALAGDSSDNIPGVPTIGIKTAAELINTYGNLEELLKRVAEVKQPKRRQNLIDFADKVLIYKQLVQLDQNVPLKLDVEALQLQQPVSKDLYNFLLKQDFNNLINRLMKRGMIKKADINNDTAQSTLISYTAHLNDKIQNIATEYSIITNIAELKNWTRQAKHLGLVAFNIITTSSDPSVAELVGFSLALKPGIACYLPLANTKDSLPSIDFKAVIQALAQLLSNNATIIVGHNIKYAMRIMLRYDIEINNYEDTMLMSYVLDGLKRGNELQDLSLRYCNHRMINYSEITKLSNKRISFKDVALMQASQYAAEYSDIILRTYHVLKQKIMQQRCNYIYRMLDLPLLKILAIMENKGICINKEYLQKLDNEFTKKIGMFTSAIYKIAKREFNIASPKQLSEVLFNELKLPHNKKNKSGNYSTDIDILENLATQGYEIAGKLIDWRHYTKLHNTYIEGLLNKVDYEDRIHTNYGFNTLTGRLSSAEPNLQNIPIRTELGQKIRQALIAQKGYKLVSFDYSQIELRLLAHIAKIPSLIECFRNELDIHAQTAAEIFKLPLKSIDSKQRYAAKAINFGIIYGISAFGLAKQLNISRAEANDYIALYNKRYPGILNFMAEQKDFARKHEFVQTLLGRKCYIQGMHSANFIQRSFAERQAINAVLQGSAADIIKKAMNNMVSILANYNNDELSAQKIAATSTQDLTTQTKSTVFQGIKLPRGVTVGIANIIQQKSKEISSSHDSPLVWPNYHCNCNDLSGKNIRLLLQVHDELIFEVSNNIIDNIVPKLQKIMEKTLSLTIPLTVNYSVGNTWQKNG